MPRLALLLLLLACALWPHPARAQVQHCLSANGTRIYTDRACRDLGASVWQPAPAATADSVNRRLGLCPRSLQRLAFQLESALDAGDANRLAGLYDWAGMGGAAADTLLSRLQAIAARRLIGVQPLTDALGQTIGLQVEQVQADGVRPAQVSFGLQRRLGCWWLRL